ncbi:MAG: M20 family metallopeptidase [Candidatus Zixiibacteriota bacterium]
MTKSDSLLARFDRFGQSIEKSIIELRRQLHQYPEIGHQEIKTTARLKKELAGLKLKIHDGHAPTGLWAELETGKKGPVIAVRTDIDALPITEMSGLPFASKYPGFCHACGHDVHMSVLIGTARILTKFKDELCGTVKFLCQPAEEVPPGGAKELIAAGVLKNPAVDAILALHVDPDIPVGHIGMRDGVTMAATFDFDIIIKGRTGHAALPHRAIDAITIAAHVVSGMQHIVSRRIDPIDAVAISFGKISGGTVRNGIAESVHIEGTARSLSPTMTKKLPGLIKKAAVNIASGLGGKCEFKPMGMYPLFVSDARVNAHIAETYRELYPKGRVHIVEKVLGGEDFACYLEKVPGAMFRLGVRNSKIGADKPWHNTAFKVDESAIRVGYTTMASTVARMLAKWKGGGKK